MRSAPWKHLKTPSGKGGWGGVWETVFMICFYNFKSLVCVQGMKITLDKNILHLAHTFKSPESTFSAEYEGYPVNKPDIYMPCVWNLSQANWPSSIHNRHNCPVGCPPCKHLKAPDKHLKALSYLLNMKDIISISLIFYMPFAGNLSNASDHQQYTIGIPAWYGVHLKVS